MPRPAVGWPVVAGRSVQVLTGPARLGHTLCTAAPAPPTSIADAPIGGLGLVLVRKFAQSAGYERRDGRNCLTIGVALA